MAAVDEEKPKRTAWPTNIPEQSIYGRGADPQAAQPSTTATPKKNTAWPSNPPARSPYDAPRPDTGFGALAGRITMQPMAADAAGMAKRPLVESATSGVIANYKPAVALSAPMPGASPLVGIPAMAKRQSVNATSAGPVVGRPSKPQEAASGFGAFPGVQSVMRGSGENMSNLVDRGQYGAAAGELARATTALVPAVVSDVASPLAPVVRGVGAGVRQFFTGSAQDQAQTDAKPALSAAQPPLAQKAAAIVAAAPEGVNASQASPQAPAAQPVAGPQRIDKPGASPLFTNLPADGPSNVAMMARGAPSAQSQAAATALQGRSGFGAVNTTQGMPQAEIDRTLNNPNGTRWSATDNAIMAANIRDGIDPYQGTSRNQPTAGQQFVQQARGVLSPSTKGMSITGAQRAQNRFEREQAKALPGVLETGARIDSENTKFGMDRQRAGLDAAKVQDDMATNQVRRDASQVEIDAARQAADLQRQYLEAPTEEARAEVAKKISALSGKSAGAAKDNFMVVGGGQEWDQASGLMRNVPQRLVDVRTGQEVGVSAGQQGGQQALPPGLVVGASTKQPDGTYPVGNKTVTIKAGKVSEIK